VVAEVAEGMLVLTPLGFEASLERYVSEVPARIDPGPCPCGAGGPVLDVS